MGVNVAPAVPDENDPSPIEVGSKFYSDVPGTISAIRFFKSAKNTGTHIGNIWSETGTRLSTVTFTGETATGWQTASLAPPLAVTANTKYVVSYYAPAGHYAQDAGYFYNNPAPDGGAGRLDSDPLHFTRSMPANPNGFYRYASASAFPDQVYAAENYWVDAVFSPSASPSPTVSSVSPATGATAVAVAVKPSATFNQGVTGSSVVFSVKDGANAAVAGTVSYDSASKTAAFTPGAALAFSTTYTATVSGATNAAGQTMVAPYSWTFTTSAATAAPTVVSVVPLNNASAVAVAVNPSATFSQAVTGSSVVFSVKDGANAVVAGTVSYDSASKTATFTPGAALAFGTTYTATVSGATNAAGQAMAAPYSWTFTSVANPPPSVASVSPANSAPAVDVAVKPAVTFDQAVTAASVVFTVKDAANASVAGAVSYDATARTATFTPASALAFSTTYGVTVSGATNATGQTLAPYSWTFTTSAAPAVCPCSVFNATSVPAVLSVNDGNAVEVGMKFRSDTAGTVTGVRFYKGSSNTGTHTGHLWSGTGTLLASVTFTGETASGWQQASFSSPVSITADTTYVVSYFAPNGAYSASGGYFSSAADKAPLHGLASGTDGPNGVFRYGSTAFPSGSFNNTNYWVDVVFNPGI
jgi:hypothetical protein